MTFTAQQQHTSAKPSKQAAFACAAAAAALLMNLALSFSLGVLLTVVLCGILISRLVRVLLLRGGQTEL